MPPKKMGRIGHAEQGSCRTSDLSALLEINASRTKVYLKELITDGVIVAEGANRNRVYRLKEGKS